jgi:PAS domain S-box-containing protein
MEGKKILLVEDEEITALIISNSLRKFHYEVYHACNGEQALRFLTQQQIDLIIMDIDLGNEDGTKLAKNILKSYNIPILFHSSHTEPEIVKKTEDITSYGYVVKNTGNTVLDASIKMALKLFFAHQELAQKKMELFSYIQELQASNEQLIETEIELEKSQEMFSKLFERNPAIVVLLRTEDGKIVQVNESWTRFTGYSKEESLGKTPMELGMLSIEEKEKYNSMLYQTKFIENFEASILDKFGNKKYFLFSASLVEIDREFFSLISAVDITEKLEFEKALIEKNLEFEIIFQLTSELFFRTRKDFVILKFLAGPSSRLYDPSLSFIGKTISETLPEPTSSKLMQAIQKSISQRKKITVNYTLPNMYGEKEGYYKASMFPITDSEVIVIVNDITQKKVHQRKFINLNKICNFINKVNKLLLLNLKLEDLLQEICNLAFKEGKLDFAWALVIKNSQFLPISFSDIHTNYLQSLNLNHEKNNFFNQIIDKKEILYFNNLNKDPWLLESLDYKKNYKSLLLLPIYNSTQTLGFLNFYSSQKDFFSKPIVQILETFQTSLFWYLEKNKSFD